MSFSKRSVIPGLFLTHHDAQRGKVLPVGGEGVGGHLPATFPQSCGDVEDAVVGDVAGRVNANTGSSSRW